ncbi:expressed unknown protein [Seminavis robusta]|uniref:Uncharacterized protein n=1 Tax=Seminavis robusta TaxID=568900 RepID=A0A9N8HDY4_9STRA|nr:expressed unknown protein [Seminavis robusta]|eukprot:Sro485_g152470.1 n/a (856) ;mRNA; f:45727-48372
MSSEEESWVTKAAAADGGKGLALEEYDPDNEVDMLLIYKALKEDNPHAQRRLKKFIRSIRSKQPQHANAAQACLRVEELVRTELKGWKASKPELDPFQIDEKAAFYCFWREDRATTDGLACIPAVPNSLGLRPSLLLFDLENERHKVTRAYQYIDTSQKVAAINLYGTSGAGKTRSIFEYLSHNYGFYLNAGADAIYNPGTMDFKSLLSQCLKEIKKIDSDDNETRKEETGTNLAFVTRALSALLSVRTAVLNHINAILSSKKMESLTCHEWLLVQLFPDNYLGSDVFQTVYVALFNNQFKYTQDTNNGTPKMSCFLDEAQLLLKELVGAFYSSNGHEKRSAYYACLQGLNLLSLSDGIIHYPCFSGTGMSIEDFHAEMKSLVNKPKLKDHHIFFGQLKTMEAADVIEYISKFLDISSLGDDLVDHVGKWLTGRPRWVATFIETYLEKPETKYPRTDGRFSKEELPFIKALNRYIEICTEKSSTNPRWSWDLQDRSAYSAVRHMYDEGKGNKNKMEWSEVHSTFQRAVFDFSLGGKVQVVDGHAAKLIEQGIAAVDIPSTDDSSSQYVCAKVCEPLIIQASLNLFGLNEFVTKKLVSTGSDSEKGNVFEEFLLPSVQHRFLENIQSQFGKDFLKDHMVPGRSSYGVLATKCDKPSDTIKWTRSSLEARFEGAFAPFCFPDTLFGPDLTFFMRNKKNWDGFHFVVVQAKLKFELNVADALRTLVPELFFHKNRGTTPSSSLEPEIRQRWTEVENNLFNMKEETQVANQRSTRSTKSQSVVVKKRRQRPVLRVLVEFPARRNESANSGPVHPSAYKSGRKGDGLHDHLMTFDEENAHLLFGVKDVDTLRKIKRRRTA